MMMTMKRQDAFISLVCRFSVLLVLVLIPSISLAKPVTFQREYSYKAGEADSKLSCRAISLEQVKRLLLEELGTYLKSTTEIKNLELTKDQITVMTAGVTQTEILDEQWDGTTYVLIAKITADPKEVASRIEELRKDSDAVEELERSRRTTAEALKEVEALKKELALAKNEISGLRETNAGSADAGHKGRDENTAKDTGTTVPGKADRIDHEQKAARYQKAVNTIHAAEWFEKGFSFMSDSKYPQAIEAFTKAIETDPNRLDAYILRGVSFMRTEHYEKARQDAETVLKKDKENHRALFLRGMSYMRSGDKRLGRYDIKRAASLGNRKAREFLRRKGSI